MRSELYENQDQAACRLPCSAITITMSCHVAVDEIGILRVEEVECDNVFAKLLLVELVEWGVDVMVLGTVPSKPP